MAKNLPATIELTQEIIPNRTIRWSALIGFWLLVGVISSLHWWYINAYFQGVYANFWEVLRVKLVVWLVWGAVTPLLLKLGERFQITRNNWLRLIPLHICFSVLVGLGYSLLYAIALLANLGRPVWGESLENMMTFVLSIHTTFFVLATMATIMLEHGLSYLRDVRRRELREVQLESRLAQAQWQNLRAQLNPHFLFNVLNTSASQLLAGKQEEAHETLVKVSELLRMSLEHSESQFTTLKKEVDFARRYLDLIRSRFPDRLSVVFDINPDTEAASVPALVLQPLVENAVKHGVGRSTENARIRIISQVQDELLILSVDNIGSADTPADAAQGAGIGLKNLRERLMHLYRDDASVELRLNGGAGASAIVRLPFEISDDGSAS